MIKKISIIVFSLFSFCIAHAQLQLTNGNFEEWEDVSYKKSVFSTVTGKEPKNWSSFIDATGGYKSMAVSSAQLEQSTDSHGGTYSAKITAKSVLTVVAQGNLTNGCVNMGSMSASDASGNYNYINESRDDQAMKFTGHPDAVKVYTKFSGSGYGNIEVILTTKGYYQSPEGNTITATKVAKAQDNTFTTESGWTEHNIKFNYFSEADPYYVLVNVSTSATAGEGSASDYMYVDDFEMVYYSHLTSASNYNGNKFTFKATEERDSIAEIDDVYDEDNLNLVSGAGADVLGDGYDEETGEYYVYIEGEDLGDNPDNYNYYTLKFKVKANMKVNAAAKYGTFCAPYDVVIPDELDVTAYTATLNGDALVLDELEDDNIPAWTPVILYSESGVDHDFIEYSDIDKRTDDGSDNHYCLTGAFAETTLEAGDGYVLQNQNGRVGFYPVKSEMTVPAHRAYIAASQVTDAKALYFQNDQETAIKALNALTNGELKEIYSESGARQDKLQKGMNIVKMADGSTQKILVK